MKEYNVPIQSLIDHIKTAIDIDPWAKYMAVELLKKHLWHDASERPPREGQYIVWGLFEFTPDHNDQQNAYWKMRIANWSDRYGWDTKVKFWTEFP